MGASVDTAGIARHYRGLIDVLVIDESDAGEADAVAAQGIKPVIAPAIMRNDADRAALARASLAAAGLA